MIIHCQGYIKKKCNLLKPVISAEKLKEIELLEAELKDEEITEVKLFKENCLLLTVISQCCVKIGFLCLVPWENF